MSRLEIHALPRVVATELFSVCIYACVNIRSSQVKQTIGIHRNAFPLEYRHMHYIYILNQDIISNIDWYWQQAK